MKLYAFAISALAIGALASCSNDIKDPADNTSVENLTMNIARTPDFVAWSGSNSFGDTRANTRAEGDEENSVQESHKPMNPEVEVNLAINSLHQDTNADEAGKGGANYTDEDLVSKLSIHIRCATNVKVVIPVGPDFYCDQDDLFIFNQHDVEHLAYGPSSSLP